MGDWIALDIGGIVISCLYIGTFNLDYRYLSSSKPDIEAHLRSFKTILTRSHKRKS